MGFSLKQYTENEWLKGSDFDEDERVVLTIKNISKHTFESGDVRPVLEFAEPFKGMHKKLSLNKTRGKKIRALFGDDSDDCLNKRITVFAGDVSFGGKPEKTVIIAAYKTGPALNPDEEFMKDL